MGIRRIKLQKIESGICPYCGSTDIDYGASEHQDDMMAMHSATCCECHRKFEEWYRLEFVGHNVGDRLDICTDAGDENIEIEMEDD